jgi:DNA-binding beta-propeller fold protein YncE
VEDGQRRIDDGTAWIISNHVRTDKMNCANRLLPRLLLAAAAGAALGLVTARSGLGGEQGIPREGCELGAASDSPDAGFVERTDGRITLVAGNGPGGDAAAADRAEIVSPFGVAFDSIGTLFFVEMTGRRVRKIGKDGLIATVAGTGREGSGGDDGPAARAELNGPHSLAVTKNGDVLVADTWNNRVRKIEARSGRITNFAGTGRKGFSGDGGPAAQADFGGIYCLALDEAGQALYLADLDNRRIRRIDLKTGMVTTVAGNGKKGVPADGDQARSAPLVDPRAVALDRRSNLYILERSGNALRFVDESGRIRTVAGTGETGDSGDGGDARHARLNGPKHLCVDSRGNVLIADTENHRIREYRPGDGTIWALAGTGRKGSSGLGGPARDADLNQPHGVTEGPGGIIYIADSSNNRILKVEP